MNNAKERLVNGIVKENPTFVLMLGMCPTLAVTTSAVNGLGMGLTTTVVLALSNVFISLLRGIIPDKVRIPAFIVIIASFVTVVELLLQGYIPFLYDALGIYIPLIVVNCIILGRAEAYAYKNPVLPSLFDGIGMGLGFSAALTCIGAVRELLGAGEIFGIHVMPESYVPVSIFIMAPGAFFVLALLTAIQNKVKISGERKGKDMSRIQSGCGNDCMNCSDAGCAHRIYDDKTEKRADGDAKKQIAEAKDAEIKTGDSKNTEVTNGEEQTKEEKKNG
jgi:electron transport complex protein RnfE